MKLAHPPANGEAKYPVNLPETSFPMKADAARRELDVLSKWRALGLPASAAPGMSARVLLDGPPYANGPIHIGHAVNKTLKDIVVKAWRLEDADATFVHGWDCQGLPIEAKVEKRLGGRAGREIEPGLFREACRKYALTQVDGQRADFERLGVHATWSRPYLTLNPKYTAGELRVLGRVIANGHLVRGYKPVHWCAECASALAEAEVEYAEARAVAIDVAFAAVDPLRVGRIFRQPWVDAVQFLAMTTTAWSLPANQGLCVHPDVTYALVSIDGRVVVVARDLLKSCAERYGTSRVDILGLASGKELEGLVLRHPYEEGKLVPMVLSTHVTLSLGTGLVHLAAAHGLDDFQVAQRYGIAMVAPLQDNGLFADGTPVVGGMTRSAGSEAVIEELLRRDTLVHQQSVTHSVAHCWRHKSPLIYRATWQWFISMSAANLRERALAAIAATRWTPAWGEARMRDMVATRPDWCISRQRSWGAPLAVFFDRDTGEMHPDTVAILGRVADAVAERGVEAWFGSSAADWLSDEDCRRYVKCTDTLDVWFDSGCVQQCGFLDSGHIEVGELAPPADLYLEGGDQFRGWFMASLLIGVAISDRAPFKRVLCHGFTTDEAGRKMSKSLGNVIAPQAIIDEFGADVLRLWACSADIHNEIAISRTVLLRVVDVYRRIRNTLRFILGNLKNFDPERHLVAPASMVAIDVWALGRAAHVQKQLRTAYEQAHFHQVAKLIHDFCVDELGAIYLDMLKDRLYTLAADAPARRSAQSALYHLGESLVRWICPVLSYMADEVWALLPSSRPSSVFLARWYELPAMPSLSMPMDLLLELRAGGHAVIERARKERQLGGPLEAALEVLIHEDELAHLRPLTAELPFWFGVSSVNLAAGNDRHVAVRAAAGPKCARCWRRSDDVGRDRHDPLICERCRGNLIGLAEPRAWF